MSTRLTKILDCADVQRIYNDYVVVNNTSDYLCRYNRLPLEKNNKKWRWEGKNFARIITILEFERLIHKYNISSEKLLTFNGADDPELEYLDFKERINIDYDEKTGKNDLHNIDADNICADFVILSQTLEHLYDPILALQNIYTALKQGAYIFASIPVVNIQHSTPFHYYMGFTPTGLGSIFESAGFKIVEIGQWGNQKYIDFIFARGTWPDFKDLRMGLHGKNGIKMMFQNPFYFFKNGLKNIFLRPVDAWILAKKV